MANIDVNGTGNANLIFGRGAGNANLSFGGSGSGGGTSDYTLLRNKPSINGVTLIGNKTSSDLYIHDLVTVDYNSSSFSLIDAAADRQQDVVCIYRPTIDELYYLPLTHYDTPTHTYTFSGIYDGKMVSTSVNQSGTWTNKTDKPRTVFYAEYGDTTYASVTAAIAADMYVVCVFSFLSGPYSGGPFYAPLLYNNDQHDTFHFYTMFGKTGYGFTLDSTDGWSQIGQDSFEQVQSDWSVTDADSPAYIGNKPTIPSKTSDLTNDSGFLTVSTVPNDVFYAAYNSTTYAAVLEAFEDGKAVICNNSNHYYPLLEYSPSAGTFIFSGVNNTTRVQIELRQSGGWQTPDEESLIDIFWATYGTTTSAEIEAAYQAGKMVCVYSGYDVYTLSYWLYGNVHRFSRSMGVTADYIQCSNDVWSYEDCTLIPISQKGANSGVCPLDASGKIDASYLPVYNGGVS